MNNMLTEDRRRGIGGSDSAAVLGLSAYTTPYSLWCEKMGILPPKEDNEAMRLGRVLEPYVDERFREATGFKTRRVNKVITSQYYYPYSYAHIDRAIVGQRAGVEYKTISMMRAKEFEEGKYPQEFLCQCLHYLAVTGWETWYLAVLILQTDFKIFRIDRETVLDEINEVMTAERDFWERYVLTKIPPPMDGERGTTEALNSIYRTAVDNSVDLSHMEGTAVRLAALEEDRKALDKEIEQCKQEFKLAMGENTRAECAAWIFNWRQNKNGTRTFTKKLKGA